MTRARPRHITASGTRLFGLPLLSRPPAFASLRATLLLSYFHIEMSKGIEIMNATLIHDYYFEPHRARVNIWNTNIMLQCFSATMLIYFPAAVRAVEYSAIPATPRPKRAYRMSSKDISTLAFHARLTLFTSRCFMSCKTAFQMLPRATALSHA